MLRPLLELTTLPRVLWLLAGANFINRCGTMVVAFLALYYVRSLGFSLENAGWLVACYSWGSLAAAPLSAFLTARMSAMRVLLISLGGAGVSMLVFPLWKTVPELAVGGFFLGMVAELGRPASYTVIGQYAPPERLRESFTLHRLAVNLGMSVGPAVGGMLALHSYEWLFFVDGASSLIAAALLVLLGPRKAPVAASPGHTPPGRLSPVFGRYLVAHTLAMVVFVQLFVGLPLHVVQVLNRPESFSGWLFTLNTALVLLCEPWITQVTRAWPLPRALALGNLFQAVGLGAFALVGAYWITIPGVMLFTLGEMLQSPANSAYLNRLAGGGRLLGTANAWFVGCGSLAFIVTPPLVGWVLERYNYQVLWASVGAVGLVAALLMWRLPASPQE